MAQASSITFVRAGLELMRNSIFLLSSSFWAIGSRGQVSRSELQPKTILQLSQPSPFSPHEFSVETWQQAPCQKRPDTTRPEPLRETPRETLSAAFWGPGAPCDGCPVNSSSEPLPPSQTRSPRGTSSRWERGEHFRSSLKLEPSRSCLVSCLSLVS